MEAYWGKMDQKRGGAVAFDGWKVHAKELERGRIGGLLRSALPGEGQGLAQWGAALCAACKELDSELEALGRLPQEKSLMAAMKGLAAGYALSYDWVRQTMAANGKWNAPAPESWARGGMPTLAAMNAFGYMSAFKNARAAKLWRCGVRKSENGNFETDGPAWLRKWERGASEKAKRALSKALPAAGLAGLAGGVAASPVLWAAANAGLAKMFRAGARVRRALAGTAAQKAQAAAEGGGAGLMLEAFGDYVSALAPLPEAYATLDSSAPEVALALAKAALAAAGLSGDPKSEACFSMAAAGWRYDAAPQRRLREEDATVQGAAEHALSLAETVLDRMTEDGKSPEELGWPQGARGALSELALETMKLGYGSSRMATGRLGSLTRLFWAGLLGLAPAGSSLGSDFFAGPDRPAPPELMPLARATGLHDWFCEELCMALAKGGAEGKEETAQWLLDFAALSRKEGLDCEALAQRARGLSQMEPAEFLAGAEERLAQWQALEIESVCGAPPAKAAAIKPRL